MICKKKKPIPSLKQAHRYVSDDTQRWEDLVLKGRLLISFAREKRKHAHSGYLLYHFLNQGHLFLGGKREMFLKARLSIKIYWLLWRPLTTQDCTLCSTLWFSLFKGSALSKNKLVFQLFIAKFIMRKVINTKVFYLCVDRCHMWINQGTIP